MSFSVEIASGKMTNLSKVDGTHRVKLSENGSYLIDNYSSISIAGETRIIDTKGNVKKNYFQLKTHW